MIQIVFVLSKPLELAAFNSVLQPQSTDCLLPELPQVSLPCTEMKALTLIWGKLFRSKQWVICHKLLDLLHSCFFRVLLSIMRIKMFLPNSFQLFSRRQNKSRFLLVCLSANFIWYKWCDIHCKTCTTFCCEAIYFIFPIETCRICTRAVKSQIVFSFISFIVWLPTAGALLEHDSLCCFTWKNTRNVVLSACSDTLLFYHKMADIVHKFSITYWKLPLLGQYVYDVPCCPY